MTLRLICGYKIRCLFKRLQDIQNEFSAKFYHVINFAFVVVRIWGKLVLILTFYYYLISYAIAINLQPDKMVHIFSCALKERARGNLSSAIWVAKKLLQLHLKNDSLIILRFEKIKHTINRTLLCFTVQSIFSSIYNWS